MASSQESGTSIGRRMSLFERLEAKPYEAAYGAFALAVVFGCASVILAIKYRTNNLPVTLWAFLLGVCFLVAGVWRLLGQTSRMPERDFVRLQVLVLGGVLGSLTVLFLGLGLTWNWWETISGGWQVWQGKEGWRLWVVLLALVAGLAIMFISLQFCRGDEASSSIYRRLIYAYNAFLSVWLLLLVLVVVNVLVYVPWGPLKWFNTTNYWAKSSMYGLSPRSEKVLESLDQPLKVYVLLPRPDPWYPETRVLMDNSRQFARNMQVEYLSPDLDREKITKLNEEFKFGDRRGILLVYGKSSEARNRFIKYTDMVERPDPRDMDRKSGSFNGEKAFINELYTLSEDKEKPIIYFTQGNGEPDLFDSAQSQQPDDKGLGLLKQRLDSVYYKVKGLKFSPVAGAKSDNPDLVIASEVPEDAAVVVVAGPKEKVQDAGLAALNKFMNPPPGPNARKPGKMIVLLDVYLTREKAMQQTGLEGFLAQFGVEVGNNVVLHAPVDAQPLEYVRTMMNPDESVRERNAIVSAFSTLMMRQYKVRTITPVPNTGAPSARYRQDPIIYADPDSFIWAENQVGADFVALTNEHIRRGDIQDLLSKVGLPIAVAVSESTGPPSGNPHASLQDGDKPRLIVVGDVTWITNFFMFQRLGTINYDIFNSMLAWLRERPNNIGIDAKKRESYALAPNADLSRMFWVPSILMVVGVIGLGAGVWVVRRR